MRDRAELEQQARLFGADWRTGDRVQTWLNRHEGRAGELSRLVEDGWTWADIGRAMHLAGITYRTGELISADILRKKASESRSAMQAKKVRLRARSSVTVQAAPAAHAMPPDGPDSSRQTDAPIEGQEFRPATLIGHSGRKRYEPAPEQPPRSVPSVDVSAVLARLTGRT